MSVSWPFGHVVSISILGLLVILVIVISGHCTFGIGFSGGHAELGLH